MSLIDLSIDTADRHTRSLKDALSSFQLSFDVLAKLGQSVLTENASTGEETPYFEKIRALDRAIEEFQEAEPPKKT